MTKKQSAGRASFRRRPQVMISQECMDRLERLAEGAYQRNSTLADRLLDELDRAKIVSAESLPDNVVTIGRQVTYRDETTGEDATVTLVFPEDADIARGRISILTPVGVALIGLAEDASLSWETRSGETRILKVLKVSVDVAAGSGGH